MRALAGVATPRNIARTVSGFIALPTERAQCAEPLDTRAQPARRSAASRSSRRGSATEGLGLWDGLRRISLDAGRAIGSGVARADNIADPREAPKTLGN